MVRNDHCHDLPASLAGDIRVGEVLGCGRRGKRDDESDCDHQLLHGDFLSGVWSSELAAERGRVRVDESVGECRRGKRDDQGDGDQKLLHGGSPLDVGWPLRFRAPAGWPCVSVRNNA